MIFFFFLIFAPSKNIPTPFTLTDPKPKTLSPFFIRLPILSKQRLIFSEQGLIEEEKKQQDFADPIIEKGKLTRRKVLHRCFLFLYHSHNQIFISKSKSKTLISSPYNIYNTHHFSIFHLTFLHYCYYIFFFSLKEKSRAGETRFLGS